VLNVESFLSEVIREVKKLMAYAGAKGRTAAMVAMVASVMRHLVSILIK
jgi:hypothetical protein